VGFQWVFFVSCGSQKISATRWRSNQVSAVWAANARWHPTAIIYTRDGAAPTWSLFAMFQKNVIVVVAGHSHFNSILSWWNMYFVDNFLPLYNKSSFSKQFGPTNDLLENHKKFIVKGMFSNCLACVYKFIFLRCVPNYNNWGLIFHQMIVLIDSRRIMSLSSSSIFGGGPLPL
jgi:hypothetical protein